MLTTVHSTAATAFATLHSIVRPDPSVDQLVLIQVRQHASKQLPKFV
jgi:hypothetical protein